MLFEGGNVISQQMFFGDNGNSQTLVCCHFVRQIMGNITFGSVGHHHHGAVRLFVNELLFGRFLSQAKVVDAVKRGMKEDGMQELFVSAFVGDGKRMTS